ncbi:MAG: GDP-mannose 4,6-dehydratase [Geobacteraceae bacterium]|nr:GDP-mannose 4,6-dehydratase [Geobacteraceae bacterium]
MKILITGGAGFIGSHLAENLLNRGDSVSVLDDLSTGSFENIRHLTHHPGFSFAIDKIENSMVLDRLASAADSIVHLAAAVGVQLIVDRPTETIETNILGTSAVLSAARRYRCRTIVASTSEVYGKSEQVPYSENQDLVLGSSSKSRWCYAASKLIDEFLSLALYDEYQLPVTVIRLFNTVGPRQTGRYGMVLPRFVNWALRGEPLLLYGSGQQSRCFCHVRDVVNAITGFVDKPSKTAGQIYNVGNNSEITIENLAKRVIQLSGSKSIIKYIPYEEAYGAGFEDMKRRIPAIDKITRTLDWAPIHSLDECIADIIEFEKNALL